jgi:hypothetical protein
MSSSSTSPPPVNLSFHRVFRLIKKLRNTPVPLSRSSSDQSAFSPVLFLPPVRRSSISILRRTTWLPSRLLPAGSCFQQRWTTKSTRAACIFRRSVTSKRSDGRGKLPEGACFSSSRPLSPAFESSPCPPLLSRTMQSGAPRSGGQGLRRTRTRT